MTPSQRLILSSFAPPNNFQFSEQFDNAAWTKVATTASADQTTAPDGTLTADKLIASVATSSHYIEQAAVGQTMSIYAKAAENGWMLLYSGNATSNIYFNLSTGVVGTVLAGVISYSIVPAGNGWYRCSATWATPSTIPRIYGTTGDTVLSWTGNGVNGIYIWGAMLNNGTRVGRYRKTPA